MATISIKFRAPSSVGKEGVLYYRVIHNRIARQLSSGYRIYPQEWDGRNMEVICPPGTGENRRRYLNSLKEALLEDTRRLRGIVSHFEHAGSPYTAGNVVEAYRSPADGPCFVSFANEIVAQM